MVSFCVDWVYNPNVLWTWTALFNLSNGIIYGPIDKELNHLFQHDLSTQRQADRRYMHGHIYWTPKETLQSTFLYHVIKCDNMAFLHLVKVVRDVFFFGQLSNFNYVQWSKTFVGWFERCARPARYLYFRILWRWKKQYRREGIFQNNKKSSEVDNKTHT